MLYMLFIFFYDLIQDSNDELSIIAHVNKQITRRTRDELLKVRDGCYTLIKLIEQELE